MPTRCLEEILKNLFAFFRWVGMNTPNFNYLHFMFPFVFCCWNQINMINWPHFFKNLFSHSHSLAFDIIVWVLHCHRSHKFVLASSSIACKTSKICCTRTKLYLLGTLKIFTVEKNCRIRAHSHIRSHHNVSHPIPNESIVRWNKLLNNIFAVTFLCAKTNSAYFAIATALSNPNRSNLSSS